MKVPQFINDRSNYKVMPSCNFIVTFGVVGSFAFQSVSGMDVINSEFRYINEGGRNDRPIRLRQPYSSPHKLTFTRGVPIALNIGSTALETLKRKIMSQKNMIGFIFALDGGSREVNVMYSFISEGIIEHTFSDLNSTNTEIFVETMTITHMGLNRLFVPPTIL